jgi:hypothetical protein
MLDVDTFLTALYVIADGFCQSRRTKRQPGPEPSLSESEILTLAIFARWSRFASERDFFRYASGHLREASPTLPDRSQFNRSVQERTELIEEMALHLAEVPEARRSPYEALDSSAMPVRDAKRRGAGWLAGSTPTSDGPTASGLVRGLPFARRRRSPRGDYGLLLLCRL